MAIDQELWEALLPVVDALDALSAPYHVGGSVASSLSGISRATQDVDLVADLRVAQAQPLANALQDGYYVDAESIREAIRDRKSFNLIHLETLFKIDVFIPEESAFARENMARRVRVEVSSIGRGLWLSSPEDIVLHKLDWYRRGGEVSKRQWDDALGVLKLQGKLLDLGYLERWAAELSLSDLLHRALAEAGLEGPA